MIHLSEAVSSKKTGKYVPEFPKAYEDVDKEIILSILEDLDYKQIGLTTKYIGIEMYEFAKDGMGCYSIGEFLPNRKESHWFRICAPYSKDVFFIRMPGLSNLTNYWIDRFKSGTAYEQLDNLLFSDFRADLVKELGLK